MSAEQQDRGQHEGPLDPRDYSRRTLPANERLPGLVANRA